MKIKDVVNAENGLSKLLSYGYLPASHVFNLSLIKSNLLNMILAYHEARNALLAKYGESADGSRYTVLGEENIAAYSREIEDLEWQEIDIVIPKEKLFLCVESIERIDKDLSPDKQLGFSANDWSAIKEVIAVIEKEE